MPRMAAAALRRSVMKRIGTSKRAARSAVWPSGCGAHQEDLDAPARELAILGRHLADLRHAERTPVSSVEDPERGPGDEVGRAHGSPRFVELEARERRP